MPDSCDVNCTHPAGLSNVEAHQTRRAGIVPAASALIVLLETGKHIEPRTIGLGPRQVPIEVTCPGIPAAAKSILVGSPFEFLAGRNRIMLESFSVEGRQPVGFDGR